MQKSSAVKGAAVSVLRWNFTVYLCVCGFISPILCVQNVSIVLICELLNETEGMEHMALLPEKNQMPADSSLDSLALYGVGIQKEFAAFIGNIYALASDKNHLELVEKIVNAVDEINYLVAPKSHNPLKNIFLLRIEKEQDMQDKNDQLQTKFREIAALLNDSRINLMADVGLFDELNNLCRESIRHMGEFIQLYEQRILDTERQIPVGDLYISSGNVLSNLPHFQRKLRDFQTSRAIMRQTLAKIELLQRNNRALCEQMDVLLSNTIPLWSLGASISSNISQQKN